MCRGWLIHRIRVLLDKAEEPKDEAANATEDKKSGQTTEDEESNQVAEDEGKFSIT